MQPKYRNDSGPRTARGPFSFSGLRRIRSLQRSLGGQCWQPKLGFRVVNHGFVLETVNMGREAAATKRLERSPVGRLVHISGFDARFGEEFEAKAFVPRDLPNRLTLADSTWHKVSEAAIELARLDAAATFIPRSQLVARIVSRREAIGTSALEGTYATLTELLAAEVLPDDRFDTHTPPQVREVMNYVRAAEDGFAWIQDRPITIGLLSRLQAQIVRGTSSDGAGTGALRTTQVFIGATDRRVAEARFVPPPPGDQLRAMCERWASWLEDPTPRKNITLVARLALAHYQFEALHPFTDGNGRLGRLIIVLQTLREGALHSPVLAISPWLEERASTYRNHLFDVSATGEWGPWIEFFADAIISESQSGRLRIVQLLSLRDEIIDTVRTARPRARLALDIAADLIAHPLVSVGDIQRRHGLSNQTCRDAVATLVELDILEPYDESRYDKVYFSPLVLQAINRAG